ncbi:hypothetical protein JEQ12_011917 [Ovis aries]|uniref:Uncharacterized protein n=1 Tax=Ovis aries TaxID=9940 RepID=A0A835ZR67_SHEEP|nr:hypothetical protein JEQ12_011917 [Ovis aries]
MIWKNMASQVYEMVLTYNVVAAGILDEVMAVLSSTDWDTKFPSPAPSPRHHPWNSTGHTVDIPYLLLVQFHQMDKPVKSKKSLYNSHNFLSPHYREDSGHIAAQLSPGKLWELHLCVWIGIRGNRIQREKLSGNGDSGYRLGRCLGIDGFSLRYSCLPPALSTVSHREQKPESTSLREKIHSTVFIKEQ